jgi:signal recognition particle receptor subunit beta
LLFVVDSTDAARLDEARDELDKLLKEEELKDAMLLVYANQQDLPNALTPQEVASRLDLDSITNRAWHVEGTSGRRGDGLREGFEWVIEHVDDRVAERSPGGGL